MPAQHARTEPRPFNRREVFLSIVLVVVGLSIAVPSFIEIYATATKLMRPSMGHYAWVVPVSGEVAFTWLFIAGVLLTMRKAPAGAFRGLCMFLIAAASVTLQVYAGRSSLPDALGHLVVVGAFFIVILNGKGIITLLRGGKVRADRLTGGEWIVHPLRSAALLWWMTAWAETSKERALHRYMALLYARTITKADPRVGRRPFAWRRHLPETLRYQLSTGLFPKALQAAIDGDNGWQEALPVHIGRQLALLGRPVQGNAPAGLAQGTAQGIGQASAPQAIEGSAQGTQADSAQGTALDTAQGTAQGTPGSTPEGTAQGSGPGTAQGTAQGSAPKKDRSSWPFAKNIARDMLIARIRTEIGNWENDPANADAVLKGKRLPALGLDARLEVRMNRDTARDLLDEAYGDTAAAGRAAAR